MHAMLRIRTFLAAIVVVGMAMRPCVADLPVAAYIEMNATDPPHSIDIAWHVQGPIDMPMFTVDPRKVIATYRRIGSTVTHRAVPKPAAPFAASRVEMTMDRLTQAYVTFSIFGIPPGSYAIDIDARRALRWHGAKAVVTDLVVPTQYVYVSQYTGQGPDTEILLLRKTYIKKTAVVRTPFVIGCDATGASIGLTPGDHVDVTGFTRTVARQIGDGPYGTHQVKPTGPNGDAVSKHPYTALTALDVTFANAVADGTTCASGTTEFASASDIERYLR